VSPFLPSAAACASGRAHKHAAVDARPTHRGPSRPLSTAVREKHARREKGSGRARRGGAWRHTAWAPGTPAAAAKRKKSDPRPSHVFFIERGGGRKRRKKKGRQPPPPTHTHARSHSQVRQGAAQGRGDHRARRAGAPNKGGEGRGWPYPTRARTAAPKDEKKKHTLPPRTHTHTVLSLTHTGKRGEQRNHTHTH
jgi:hypothetical protein